VSWLTLGLSRARDPNSDAREITLRPRATTLGLRASNGQRAVGAIQLAQGMLPSAGA